MATWLWVGFVLFVVVMLAIDLGIFSRESKERTLREAGFWTIVCMLLAIAFSAVVYHIYDSSWAFTPDSAPHLPPKEATLQYLTAWVVEQSLSLDNIFVMAVIFKHFGIPAALQHRVLFWGILGALVMRGVFIALGVALIQSISWVNYVFGGLLFYAAIKLFTAGEEAVDVEHNVFVKITHRFFPVTRSLDGNHFFVKLNGRTAMTPLFVALLVIESTDVLFAIDSIPAVIAVTSDPFLVFTSNVFAILCLRSLYFVLSGLMDLFKYLKYSLAVILAFVGAKMMIHDWFEIPTVTSLLIILGCLAAGVAVSLVARKREQAAG